MLQVILAYQMLQSNHMSCCLLDLLEDISRTIKKEKLQLKTDTLVVSISVRIVNGE